VIGVGEVVDVEGGERREVNLLDNLDTVVGMRLRAEGLGAEGREV
jgi:hypothetical protein